MDTPMLASDYGARAAGGKQLSDRVPDALAHDGTVAPSPPGSPSLQLCNVTRADGAACLNKVTKGDTCFGHARYANG